MKTHNSQIGESLPKKWTLCKCPVCSKEHKKRMRWTGRGIPREACEDHKKLFESEEDSYSLGDALDAYAASKEPKPEDWSLMYR